jgi:hypothetical protein
LLAVRVITSVTSLLSNQTSSSTNRSLTPSEMTEIITSFSKIAKAGAFSEISNTSADTSGFFFFFFLRKNLELFEKAVINYKKTLKSLVDI